MEPVNAEEIEIREHSMDYILGKTPGVLLRLGISVIFVVFIGILVGSSFFSYPDLITAKVQVTMEHAPEPLVGKNGGKVAELWVKDNEQVEKGQLVAVMENAARMEDILLLSDFLEGEKKDVSGILERELQLGDVQAAYTSWKYNVVAYRNFQQLQYHARSIRALKEQLTYLQEYIGYGKKQNEYLAEELLLEQKNLEVDRFLAANKVIAETELDKSKAVLLQKQYSAEVNRATLADSKMRIVQLQQNILDMELDYQKQKKELEDQIRHSREILRGQLQQWEQLYAARAPEKGKIVYNRYWVSGEFVNPGETMFTLLPDGNGKFEGRIELPMAKSGKVKVGQEVHIKLENYPYMEYGILKGQVEHISSVVNQNVYRVDVALPQGLTGSYGKELPFLQGMSGTADIVVEEQTVFQRLLFPLKSLITHYKKEK